MQASFDRAEYIQCVCIEMFNCFSPFAIKHRDQMTTERNKCGKNSENRLVFLSTKSMILKYYIDLLNSQAAK